MPLLPVLTIQNDNVPTAIIISIVAGFPDDTDRSRRGVIGATVVVGGGKKGSEAEDEAGDSDEKESENQRR